MRNSSGEMHDSTAVNDVGNVGPSVREAVLAKEPREGMEFESKDDVFGFYKEYAKIAGFDTIIKASRRSRISGKFIDAKFVCTRYGNKKECRSTMGEGQANVDMDGVPVKKKRGRISQASSKTDCKASMHVKRRKDGRWIICSFVKEHNHETFPNQVYHYRDARNVDTRNSAVLHNFQGRNRKMYVSVSRQSGGCKKVGNEKVGGTDKFDNEHVLALEEGEARVMLDHFLSMQDENPNFWYAVDLTKEQQLKNVLWVDAKSRLDYVSFSDVVCFDTSYIRNEYKLPVVPFVGVNHHNQFLVLGCAFIANESKLTLVWLLRAWLRAMGGRTPQVILTDQHNAWKEAIAEVFPDSSHCFCLWHIWSLIPEKLSYVMRQHENFMSKFNKCILRSCTVEQFEKRWFKLVDRFDLKDNLWLQSLYDDRQRWVPSCMVNIFFAGMSATQRSESINSIFDKYIQRRTTLKEFLYQYKVFLREKYEEEAKADFETWHKQPGLKSPSPFGKQMGIVYTHTIFKKFQVEVLGVVACHPKKECENGTTMTYKVQDFEENQEFIVAWNELISEISCSCRCFEYNGFLCRHAMILLQMSGMQTIPSQYILKRWTKDAKNRQSMTLQLHAVDPKVQLYSDICLQAFKLSDEGSLSQSSFSIAFNALEDALQKCQSVKKSLQCVDPGSFPLHSSNVNQEGNHITRTRKTSAKSTFQKGKGHSNFQASTLDCSYESQACLEEMERLNSRAPTLDCYFGNQQMGQQNVIAGVHDDPYLAQQRNQGLGQLHF